MKKRLLLVLLSSHICMTHAAFENNLLPQNLLNIDGSSTAETAQSQALLPSNSVINLGSNASSQFNQTATRMFGAQLFKGAFASSAGSTFNSSYIINPGDNINLRLWGAYQFSGSLTVDPQGNIFVPNVGPVKVEGIQNGQLQNVIQQNIRRVYVSNVGVYAALEQAQPVKVLVTGFVNQPGSYGGVSADSVLAYLDRAGGVDPERGSYVDVQIQRNGRLLQYINLYDFLLAGQLQPFAFKDGDVVIVAPRKHTFSVDGEVFNSYDFEFNVDRLTVAQALSVARTKPGATHVSISRRQGSEYRSEYYALNQAQDVVLKDGDVLTVTADRYAGTIQVRIEGAHNGTRAVVLPYGANLEQVLAQIQPNQLSQIQSLQLFRPSVAERQKEMLNVALDKLEEATYSVRSATQEEAQLRLRDAELVKQFVTKARQIQPKGQVILNPKDFSSVILEQGDVLNIPEKTSVIMVHGEVTFPNAVAWQNGLTAQDYINKVGGYTQKSNKSKVVVIHQNGESELVSARYKLREGDELMVLPKVTTKGIELTRGLTQIIYQIAIAAKVALDL